MEIPWEYIIHLCILTGMYLILTQSFNINFGLAGQFNLAHVASYAIGAYTTALLSTEYDSGFFTCILLGMFLSGMFAFLIGGISIKLTQDYFAIGTLAFSAIVSALLINWKSLTRGVLGIPGIPRPVVFGVELINNGQFLLLLSVFVLITLFFFYILFRSPFARVLKAQAEFEQGAQALGMNARFARHASFFLASAFAGLAGSFFAYYINYIDPTSFGLHEMIFVLTIIVVGRPGSFWGCIGAAVFLVLLPEPLRFISMPPSILGPLRQLLYALILFAVVFVNRAILFPVERKV